MPKFIKSIILFKPFVSTSAACHPVTHANSLSCFLLHHFDGYPWQPPFLILFEGEKLLAEGAVDSAHLDSDFGV